MSEKKVRLKYVGPHRGVEVEVAGRVVTVERGGSEDFPAKDAERLLAQKVWKREAEPKPELTGEQTKGKVNKGE